jgi:inorganic triphosphatase YgiF
MQGLLERHFDVDERFALPPLDSILNRGEVRRDTVDVTQVYYDTPEHDLQAQGIALYRRDGDGETGMTTRTP